MSLFFYLRPFLYGLGSKKNKDKGPITASGPNSQPCPVKDVTQQSEQGLFCLYFQALWTVPTFRTSCTASTVLSTTFTAASARCACPKTKCATVSSTATTAQTKKDAVSLLLLLALCYQSAI